jgi:hypothetical protein
MQTYMHYDYIPFEVIGEIFAFEQYIPVVLQIVITIIYRYMQYYLTQLLKSFNWYLLYFKLYVSASLQ